MNLNTLNIHYNCVGFKSVARAKLLLTRKVISLKIRQKIFHNFLKIFCKMFYL